MMGLTVRLSHARNPDIEGGYWAQPVDSGKVRHVLVRDLVDAQLTCEAFIARNELGGGNWTGGELRLDGKKIGRISYNGRAWKSESVELKATDTCLGVYARVTMGDLKAATLAARERTGDTTIGTCIKKAMVQVVRVTYPKGRTSVVEQLTDFLMPAEAVAFLNRYEVAK